MSRRLSHEAIRDLLASHALDAVEDADGATIDSHLRDCPRCRAEMAHHLEAASALATGHEPAPVRLWDNIVAELDAAPTIQFGGVLPLPATRRRSFRVGVAIAAVIVAVLGFSVVQQDHRIDRMQMALEDRTVLAAALAAIGNPDARKTELRSKTGDVLAHAVLTPDGTGYLWSQGLPATGPDRTYQLWAITGTERISAGVLGTAPEVAPFRVAGDIVGLAITGEVTGGVVASQNQPVASGLVVKA